MLSFIIILISEEFIASVSSGLNIEDVHQIQIFSDKQQQSGATNPKWDQKYSLYNQQEYLHPDSKDIKNVDRVILLLKYLCHCFFLSMQ